MSQLTNYGENQLADKIRGQVITYPAAWHLAPLSAYSDSSVTEITGAGLARVSVTRSLANFAGTQGDESTVASTGTSHTTSNNVAIDFGDATGSDTLVGVGFFDAASGGNCWAVWELETPLAFVNTDPIELAISQVKFSLGLTGGMTDYLANELIDEIFRAQAYTYPATIYHGLFTATPSNAGGGAEIGGGVGYSRASLVPSLANISGTQGAGTTTASTGTGGRVSNNGSISHPSPTGSGGTAQWGGWFDAASGGNLLWWGPLGSPVVWSSGSPAPTFAADAMGWTFA